MLMDATGPEPATRTGTRARNTLSAPARYHARAAHGRSGVLVADVVDASLDGRDDVVRRRPHEEEDSPRDLGPLRLAAKLHRVGVGRRRGEVDPHAEPRVADPQVVGAGAAGDD